jgi:hypothetical protein
VIPGEIVTCGSCGATATAYSTAGSAEAGALVLSWGRGRHVVANVAPKLCPDCEDGTRERVWTPPTRRVAICEDLANHGCRTSGFEWNTDQTIEDAYQRWVALGRPRMALVAAGGAAPARAPVAPPPAPAAAPRAQMTLFG